MSARKKWGIGIAVTALLGVMIFRALQADGGAVEVRAEVVAERALTERVSATGHIEPMRSVDISADISGRIVELAVEEGQDVREDDLLLIIDPTQFRAAVRQAQARLSEARAREIRVRADHRQAIRDWERLQSLKDRMPDLVTDSEVEQERTRADMLEAELEAARHAVDQAEGALEEAQDRLDKTVIRSPMDGRVSRVNVERGETAIVGTMNNPGSLLLTIADLSIMEAVVEVDETDVPRVSVGDSARVRVDAFPGGSYAGVVSKVGDSAIRPRGRTAGQAPRTDEAVDFEVRVTLSNPPPRIRPDLSATADIVTARRGGALSVPIISLTLRDTASLEEGWRDRLPEGFGAIEDSELEGVFVVEDDRVRFQPVEVGIAGEHHFEVLAGLSAGDTVVSGTYQAIRELQDGWRVRLRSVEGGN